MSTTMVTPRPVRGDTDSLAEAACLPIRYSLRLWLWKSIVERLLAAALLLASAPLLLLLMMLVRLTSPGPVVFRQIRVGRGGRLFTLYKIRTMHVNAEQAMGPTWSSSDDPRIVPIGRWLRSTHLDEFPQLVNVVMGQMSLVGPRPERPEFVAALVEEIPSYADRLAVAPGVTGLAQVTFGPDVNLDTVRRKLVLDKAYIDSAGILLDAQLIVCTALHFLGVPHQLSRRLTGIDRRTSRHLPQNEHVEPAHSTT